MHIERDKQANTIKPLNLRQQRFVEYYTETGNATRAAESAGYRHPNVQAFRLLENISVKASIEAIRANMSKDSEQRRAEWIDQLEDLGRAADKDSDRLRAIEALFKAEGWLAAEKKEVVQFNGAFLADLDLEEPEIDELMGFNDSKINDLH
jgi:phage terminase small subunit